MRLERPIDLAASLAGYRFGPEDPSLVLAHDRLQLAVHTPDGPGELHLALEGDEVHAEAFGPAAELLMARLPALLGAGDDPRGFQPEHPLLARTWRENPGLRVTTMPAILPVLTATIAGQRVTGKEAKRSLRALYARHGEPGPGPAGLTMAPRPELLARLSLDDYAALGFDRRRAAAIKETARVASRIEAKWGEPPAVLAEYLGHFRGVGPWTIGLVRAVALGDADAVPIGDFHLPNTVAYALAREPRADDARMLELLAPYAGHRYRVIQLLGRAGISAPRYGPRRPIGPPPGWDR